VARETRRQRRDARRAAGDQSGSGGGGIPRPARLRTAEAGGPGDSGGGSFEAAPAPVLAQRAGKRRFSFIRESIGELKKVEWPNRAQVVQGTVVVIVACAIVGVFLYGADQALRPFVQHVLLNQ
jgi:preprotein translocase subunit SecE